MVNASSEEGRLAVNGMSYSGRNGKHANSAIVVAIDEKDYGTEHVLAGMHFQSELEEKAYKLCDGEIPVQFYEDFKANVQTKLSGDKKAKDTQDLQNNMSNGTEEKYWFQVFLPFRLIHFHLC